MSLEWSLTISFGVVVVGLCLMIEWQFSERSFLRKLGAVLPLDVRLLQPVNICYLAEASQSLASVSIKGLRQWRRQKTDIPHVPCPDTWMAKAVQSDRGDMYYLSSPDWTMGMLDFDLSSGYAILTDRFGMRLAIQVKDGKNEYCWSDLVKEVLQVASRFHSRDYYALACVMALSEAVQKQLTDGGDCDMSKLAKQQASLIKWLGEDLEKDHRLYFQGERLPV